VYECNPVWLVLRRGLSASFIKIIRYGIPLSLDSSNWLLDVFLVEIGLVTLQCFFYVLAGFFYIFNSLCLILLLQCLAMLRLFAQKLSAELSVLVLMQNRIQGFDARKIVKFSVKKFTLA
jgi:hypothetical protein